MATATFDTLKFTKRLEESGISRDHAEAMADAFREAQQESGVATQNDINDLTLKMVAMELRLIKWMVGTTAGAVGVIIAAFLAVLKILVP